MRNPGKTRKATVIITIFMVTLASGAGYGQSADDKQQKINIMKEIVLPEPSMAGNISLEETLGLRRSVRRFTGEPLSMADLSQLLWAAQGVTRADKGFRTAPSAGATFPMEIFLVCAQVNGLEAGLYRYSTGSHNLLMLKSGDLRERLLETALMQKWLSQAAAILVVCADYSRTTGRYGDRGIRYVHMESGHLGQNIALQAVALGLGTTMVGAFDDHELSAVLDLPTELQPLYIIPVGRPQQ
jgi:SagB-type dehydrogenase family enzyme